AGLEAFKIRRQFGCHAAVQPLASSMTAEFSIIGRDGHPPKHARRATGGLLRNTSGLFSGTRMQGPCMLREFGPPEPRSWRRWMITAGLGRLVASMVDSADASSRRRVYPNARNPAKIK